MGDGGGRVVACAKARRVSGPGAVGKRNPAPIAPALKNRRLFNIEVFLPVEAAPTKKPCSLGRNAEGQGLHDQTLPPRLEVWTPGILPRESSNFKTVH